ncbi:MAG: 16S rRNA (adenine(1518)-N(6)/adenine(1519)-N(6))-dimethyltransferase RsmA [Rhodanobacter sp.]|nr:MAG: 16S rRNA (adenine(1518)-N(6)/adenine(1519)-N(6))-dimethyltransferase RsmA [Rhodanobacter sp.]TAM15061.1 MAG: 16S rRNA (adenine(1518)-N(6)/adenine(1519)-N(6))-dimethyltransferase RsmA [Rhodanobacter sp.]TAM36469.1 MAG: 16S rRNA (adenine(1518)-N(6)/adenine(1519)-N(6))-dimethyltransferase RsmA [Rhodanobacter sp.]
MSARPKKSFGQHFLHDTRYIDDIVRAIAPKADDTLVEIGPGEGALTLPLLAAAGTLTAIELDTDLIPALMARAAPVGLLTLLQADVLKVDFGALARERGGAPLRIAGNLPYYISSPILFHCIAHATAIRDMHFMLQKEVVDRMAAAPGSKVYGRLSVMLQLACHVVPLFEVPPAAFRPPPKVDSAVVRLVPRAAHELPAVDAEMLQQLVKAAFGQRRKTLGNALRGVLDATAIRTVGIDPQARAEALAPADFVRLAQQYAALRTA